MAASAFISASVSAYLSAYAGNEVNAMRMVMVLKISFRVMDSPLFYLWFSANVLLSCHLCATVQPCALHNAADRVILSYSCETEHEKTPCYDTLSAQYNLTVACASYSILKTHLKRE